MINFDKRSIRMWSRLGSCGAFGAAACELGETKEDLAMLTADLRFYSGLDPFAKQFPDKLYNMGIAEQNMVGVATAMAKEGMTVFATTYGTFASTRCTDQVRVGMGYMNLPVKLVGLTSGLSVGILGGTHISCEDVAILRSIPNLVVLSPADTTETVKATLAAADYPGPVYLRLTGAMGNPIVYNEDYDFEIGKAIELKEGDDIAIIATGPMVATALKVAEAFAEKGVSCSVVDMHTIKPLDVDMVNKCKKAKLVVTLEEHSVIGGLGSAVAEVLATDKDAPALQIIGIDDRFEHAAEYNCLLDRYGLTAEKIINKIEQKYMEEK